MKNIWFTSDTHFSHGSIIKHYPARQIWKDSDEQREGLIARWNDRVKPGDTVYHAGDFEYRNGGSDPVNLVRRLNGNIILIAGNHDKKMLRSNATYRSSFYELHMDSYAEFRVNGEHIVICHFPIWEWHQIHRGAWHIHGHLHGKPHGIPGKILDVGVDGHDLAPIHFDEVKKIMDKKSVRHHH